MNIDIPHQINAIERKVEKLPADANVGERIGVILRRHYDAPRDEVWDALTDPSRIGRWFMPVSGELHLGGTFQVEGNASGEILACEPPHLVRLTWGGPTSVVELHLTDDDSGTILQLDHTVPIEMAQSGAGALWVGPGWDGAYMGLGLFLAGDAMGDPVAMAASRVVQEFSQQSVHAWVAAVEASETATSDELAQAATISLAQFAPDLPTPEEE